MFLASENLRTLRYSALLKAPCLFFDLPFLCLEVPFLSSYILVLASLMWIVPALTYLSSLKLPDKRENIYCNLSNTCNLVWFKLQIQHISQ